MIAEYNVEHLLHVIHWVANRVPKIHCGYRGEQNDRWEKWDECVDAIDDGLYR